MVQQHVERAMIFTVRISGGRRRTEKAGLVNPFFFFFLVSSRKTPYCCLRVRADEILSFDPVQNDGECVRNDMLVTIIGCKVAPVVVLDRFSHLIQCKWFDSTLNANAMIFLRVRSSGGTSVKKKRGLVNPFLLTHTLSSRKTPYCRRRV